MNKDFYPTPYSLAERMLRRVDLKKVHTVLEPSAGKGDLVEAMRIVGERYRARKQDVKIDVDCIEIEPDLRAVLEDHGLRVVHDNFKTFDTYKHYDLILANFPFSDGASHIQHALNLAEKTGSRLVFLVNAETLRNPYSIARKMALKRLEEYNATIEYVSGAFADAERSTGVEVALVDVTVPAKEQESFIEMDFLNTAAKKVESDGYEETQLSINDIFRSLTDQYKWELENRIKLAREFQVLENHSLPPNSKYEKPVQELSTKSINELCEKVRQKYWKYLFTRPQFTGKLTKQMHEQLDGSVEKMKDYDFTLFNIQQLYNELMQQLNEGIEKAIMRMFDKFSYQYSWYDTSSNVHYYNGWKTNKAWKINRKVILPMNAFSTFGSSTSFDPSYSVKEELADIEKAFVYLSGGKSDGEEMYKVIQAAKDVGRSKDIDTRYFTLTFYKKGTVHIVFKDEDLLKRFNLYGARHNNWLPHDYGNKAYEDMSEDEKVLVGKDGFETREEYEDTRTRREYFLPQPKVLMIG